jgi:hypothetical protein
MYTTPETDMLRELKFAHQIIRNALNIMTLEQKLAWGEKNAQDGCDGGDDGGVTRAHQREEAIQRGAAHVQEPFLILGQGVKARLETPRGNLTCPDRGSP